MKWSAPLTPNGAASQDLSFYRTCAAFVALDVDGQRFDLRTTSSGKLASGGQWLRSGSLALTFVWRGRKASANVVIEYRGEPLRLARQANRTQAPAPRAPAPRARAGAAPAVQRANSEYGDVRQAFKVRHARINNRVEQGAPLAAEQLAMCLFDAKTDFRMPNAHRLLDPKEGPHDGLVVRVMRRGRQLEVPPPSGELRKSVTDLAPVVGRALRESMAEAFGLKDFDPNDPKHRTLLARVFCLYANGDLADPDPTASPTEGVPDSGYFFCLPEFALMARGLDKIGGEQTFFAECFKVFVRATRVYFRAYSKLSGMDWQSYGPRRFRRTWDTVEADLAKQFADHFRWDDSRWDAKYDEILAGCCLGNSQGKDYSDAEVRTKCGVEAMGEDNAISTGKRPPDQKSGEQDE